MTTLTVIPGVPDTSEQVHRRTLSRWSARTFSALKPSTLYSILKDCESGKVQDFADLCNYMLRTDPHVRSVYLTRLNSVAGAKWVLEPGVSRPGEEALAEAAVEFCRYHLEKTEDLERTFAQLLNANGLGWAGLELDWYRDRGVWCATPRWIHPREFEFTPEWELQAYDAKSGKFVKTSEHPGKFIVHLPQQIADAPNLTGDLMAIAWTWLFKRWAEKFRTTGLERFASPLLYGEVPVNASSAVRTQLLSDLEQLTADSVAVFEAGSQIKVIEAASKAGTGEAWTEAIRHYDEQITIGILGSLDNVSADSGSYARAESQASTTILPRLLSDAKRLAGTVERDWLRYILKYNMGMFDGRAPPTPKLKFELIKEAETQRDIEEFHIASGVVTGNELRAQLGLEPVPGGDSFLQAPKTPEPRADSPTNVQANPDSSPGGEATGRPLARARQMTLPLGSATTTPSQQRLKKTLENLWASPVSSSKRASSGQPPQPATTKTSSQASSKRRVPKKTPSKR